MKKFMVALLTLASVIMSTSVGVEAASLQEIKDKGQIVVGMNAEYPPFEWVAIENGETKYMGIDVALGQLIADEIGVELVIDNRAFDSLIPSLQTNKIDLIISGMAHTEAREEQVDFSIPYFNAVSQFAVPVAQLDNYSNLEDFAGKKVGVLQGSIQESFVMDNMPDAEYVSYGKHGDTMEALKAGRVDAILMADITLAQYLIKYADSAALVPNLDIENEGIGNAIAIAKGNEDLVAIVDKVIEDAIASGEMEQIFAEYTQLASENLKTE